MVFPTPVPADPQGMIDKLNSIIDRDPEPERRQLAYAALTSLSVCRAPATDAATRAYCEKRYRDLLCLLFPKLAACV